MLFFVILFGIVADLIIRSEWTYRYSYKRKIVFVLLAAAVVAAIGWRPIYQQYYEDKLGSTTQAINAIKDRIDKDTDTRSALVAIDKQLQKLMFGQVVWENHIGRPDLPQRLLIQGHILNEMRLLLNDQNIKAVSHDNGDLWLITGRNNFRVTFPTVMRIPPKITFSDVPQGVTPKIIEESQVGFWVVFDPQSIDVEKFGYTADAEL